MRFENESYLWRRAQAALRAAYASTGNSMHLAEAYAGERRAAQSKGNAVEELQRLADEVRQGEGKGVLGDRVPRLQAADRPVPAQHLLQRAAGRLRQDDRVYQQTLDLDTWIFWGPALQVPTDLLSTASAPSQEAARLILVMQPLVC